MQSKTIEVKAMDQEDKNWLDADLSHLSEMESYDWGDTNPQTTGKLIHYQQGVGFVVEGSKQSRE